METDHKALESLLSSRVLNRKLTRWALFLQEFAMTITYRSGKKNQNADGLTLQAWTETQKSMNEEETEEYYG